MEGEACRRRLQPVACRDSGSCHHDEAEAPIGARDRLKAGAYNVPLPKR